jgi:hypothetical protein
MKVTRVKPRAPSGLFLTHNSILERKFKQIRHKKKKSVKFPSVSSQDNRSLDETASKDQFSIVLGPCSARSLIQSKTFRFTIISLNPSVLIRSDNEASTFHLSGDFLVERD